MIQLKPVIILSTVCLFACQAEDEQINEDVNIKIEESFIITTKSTVAPPLLKASIDKEALNQVGQFQEDDVSTIYDLYDQEVDEVEAWTDKLWGRCCTEADMRFTEFLGFTISSDSYDSKYPFSNALDNLFATAFVFQEKDSAIFTISFDGETNMYGRLENKTANDIVSDNDTIQSLFEISIVNGYAKSAKTFKENRRIKLVEIWLNGELKNRCELRDTPEIQIIHGNFPFFKSDTIQIVPIAYYDGEEYEDVCISAFQLSLGYGAHQGLERLSEHWKY